LRAMATNVTNTNIPPPPAKKWNLRVVNLTTPSSTANVDATVSKAISSVNTQISRDFLPIWGVEGHLEIDNSAVWKNIRTRYPGGPTDSNSTEVAGEITEKVTSEILNGIDWRTTGIVYLTDGQSDFGGVHVEVASTLGFDIPYALVGCFNENWTVIFSHEVLELLADPWGKRLAKRPSKNQLWIVEVCDPSEADNFGYQIDSVLVSDFLLPDYFNEKPPQNAKLSFRGVIKEPFTVLQGGYLSYHDLNDNHWKQITWFQGNQPTINILGSHFNLMNSRSPLTNQKPRPSDYRIRKYINHVTKLSKFYPNLSSAFGMNNV